MKPYPLELRRRIVEFVGEGGSKAEAARRFKVSRMTVHRYARQCREGRLEPKPQGGSAERFADESLRRELRSRPDATLAEHGRALGVSHVAVWKRLRRMAVTLKKTPAVPGEGRGPEVALPQGAGGAGGSPGVLPRRERR